MTASFETISNALLAWYDNHARALPWRSPPGEPAPEPYRVWLSEVMLQQTTVAAVKPYFAKFTQRWPTVETLAAAPEQEVMAAWAGLGYYSRARNLVKCAGKVAELGEFPSTETELRNLPGLGAYTAAAVAAIAFGRRAVVVDANVERVVSRLFAIEEPLPGSRKTIHAHAESITPGERSGDFAQAMMDLGSGICTSRVPKCSLCPLTAICLAKRTGDPASLPVKAPKKAKPTRKGKAFWIERDGKVWLETRQGSGMLGGMRALPDDGWTARQDGSDDVPLDAKWESAGMVRHTFTHAHLEMLVFSASIDATPPQRDGVWWPIIQIDEAGLPTLYAKAARLVLAKD